MNSDKSADLKENLYPVKAKKSSCRVKSSIQEADRSVERRSHFLKQMMPVRQYIKLSCNTMDLTAATAPWLQKKHIDMSFPRQKGARKGNPFVLHGRET